MAALSCGTNIDAYGGHQRTIMCHRRSFSAWLHVTHETDKIDLHSPATRSMSMATERIQTLLSRTALFYEVVLRHVELLTPAPGGRFVVAFQSGLLSLEHARSATMLFEQGRFASGIALLRPQFECLVRGIWLLYAANDNWIAKFSEPLTAESAKQANEGVGLADMLKALETAPNAPAPIVAQLREFKDVSWKAMNSYTHGGIHALARTLSGYPEQLIYDIIRNSNALTALCTQLQSILTGMPEKMEPIQHMQHSFSDVLPIIGQA